MAQIYDNITSKFTDGLQGIILNNGVKRVDFCVGYFNLRGWDLICDQVEGLEGDFVEEENPLRSVHRTCRLLIGMHQPLDELITWIYGNKPAIDSDFVRKQKIKIAIDFRRQLQKGAPSAKDEFTLRRLSRQMKDEKVCVKLYCREPLHAKLYLAHQPEDFSHKVLALMGSSNLTYSGLQKQGELDASIDDCDNAEKLSRWFNDRWNDRFCIDITKELIDVIDNSWAGEIELPPYYIYLKIIYHLSEDARKGIQEFSLPQEFRRELFPFQEEAVKIATRHLRNNNRHGAMIGDVVGLGKTITACAIAKLYELNYTASTLVICPANLQEMWEGYSNKYDLKMDVTSMSKTIDVDNSRYYRLIIIDESHNLRNGASGKRYENIKKLIDHLNCDVLLLTATPYNKNFRDLGNQIKLFVSEDQDLGIRPEAYIRELGGERKFMQQHSDIYMRSIAAFEKSNESDDWNDLMKLFLVRRTRTFIKENYAKTDPENGRKYLEFHDGRRSYFPDRVPLSLTFETSPGDQYNRLYSDEMIDLMEELQLPRYGLKKYIKDDYESIASKNDLRIIENISRAGWRMIGICMSTFFKRIDSDGLSFLLTIYRHILRNMVFVYALEKKLKLPIGDNNTLPDDFIDDEANDIMGDELSSINSDGEFNIPTDLEHYSKLAEQYYNSIIDRDNVDWLDCKLCKRTLKQQLLKDCETLIQMIMLCGAWNPKNDNKLNRLEKLLCKTHPDEKIVVFTQYSDTANYIYRQLKRRGVDKLCLVTGASSNPTELVTRFSPKSNDNPNMPKSEQYRIAIATDVLSEGHNLQDSHIVVNFDLPWAIIRLIQRAGRVDRIGQKADTINCYSFFPAEGVEKIISLRERLNKRINENARVLGSDETFFEGNEQNLRDMFNEKSGVLDDEDDTDIDLSSQAFQIWKNAIAANPDLAKIIPNLNDMVYSTKEVDSLEKSGVVTFARTSSDYDVLLWHDENGNIKSRSQGTILRALDCNINTPWTTPLECHHDLVNKAINQVQEESESNTIGGILGKRTSVRYRLVQLLEKYYKENENNNSLFFNMEQHQELKLAIDEIYNYPLLDVAKTRIGKMLRTRSDDDIVEYVIELRKDGALCKLPTEDGAPREAHIICSMGMKYNNNNQ